MAANEAKLGKSWGDDELDAIVADYFAMLAAEQRGEPYVKSYRSAALMQQLGRTQRSVEFKHQNISAVLEALGLPWIPGYKLKRNYQRAIFGAIDRYLSANPILPHPDRARGFSVAAGRLASLPGSPLQPLASDLHARPAPRGQVATPRGVLASLTLTSRRAGYAVAGGDNDTTRVPPDPLRLPLLGDGAPA